MCERLRSRLFLQLPQGSMTLRFCPSKFTTHCPSRVHKDHSGSQFAASQVKLKGGGACETRVLPESPCSALVPRSPLTRPPRKTRGSSFRKGWAQRERRTYAIMPPPAVPAHHGDAPPRAARNPRPPWRRPAPCRPPTLLTALPPPPTDPFAPPSFSDPSASRKTHLQRCAFAPQRTCLSTPSCSYLSSLGPPWPPIPLPCLVPPVPSLTSCSCPLLLFPWPCLAPLPLIPLLPNPNNGLF